MKRLVSLVLCLFIVFSCLIEATAAQATGDLANLSQEELLALYKQLGSMLQTENEELTASDIVEKLVEIGFPIYDIETYDEATDPNKLLGRPNQYTSKCNAYEGRIRKYSDKDPSHVAVEVFDNEEDCISRYEYINSVNPVLVGQYMFMHKNVLFRVDNDLLPSEAKQYDEAVEAIVAGIPYTLEAAITVEPEPEKKEYVVRSNEDKKIQPATSREEPAVVGQRVILEDAAITILHAFVGQKANALARSFDSYNTRSYTLEKNEEWLLTFMKIEGFDTLEKTRILNSYQFSVLDKDGTILNDGDYSLYGNPREINDVIPGSVQYCWYGVPVEKGSQPILFFDDYQLGEAWFDISERIPADTSTETYTILQRNDTGLLVDRVQIALYDYGYRKDVPDKVYGNLTAKCIKQFQTDCGLDPTGLTDDETLRWLLSGKPVPEK